MLGFFMRLSQPESSKCLNFDEFLDGIIHDQLENFRMLKHFRY